MLVLDATTKSMEAVMSGAAATTNPDFVTTWADNNGTTFTEGSTDGALSGTTPVEIVGAPASSTRRTVKGMYIQNRDTAAVTVTISYNNNATLRQIAEVTLAAGDTWTTDGTYDENGNLKQIMGTVNLASQVTGTLPVANGGSGATTLTGILKGNGTSAFTAVTAPSGTIVGTSDTQTLTNKTLTAPTINTPTFGDRIIEKVVALTDGANISTDASLGNIFTVTLGGNRTLDNPTNSTDGQRIIYKFKQDGTGSRTITFGSNFRGSTDVALPTLTTTAAYVDYIAFIYDSSVTKWNALAVNKGFSS